VECAKNTRKEVLDAIHIWFKGESVGTEGALRTEGSHQGQVFWLSGVAGAGKSTIAQTIAQHYADYDQLGASFFCSKSDADCSNANMIFPTIAHQLGLFYPTFGERVSEVLAKDPHLLSSLKSVQLEKLIVKPLEAVGVERFPRCLIVIDALDEYKEENTTSSILLALSKFISRVPPFMFLFTSRPVPEVERGFHTTDLMKHTTALALHNIPGDISDRDIQIFLTERLFVIAQNFRLALWPPSEELAQLVERSSRLFIFAETAASFIEDPNASDPKQQLGIVLSTRYITSTKASPHRYLDALYLEVLHQAFPEISGELQTRLQTVLGTIILLFDPLNAESLENLLDLQDNTVYSTLRHLHSIAVVPDAGGGPVRLLHPSLGDFLVDADRCCDVKFLVHPQLQHTLLSKHCLKVLQNLSQDMCKIRDASLCNSEVDDLPGQIMGRIPAHVQYACRHWASHLSKANCDDDVLKLLHEFCLDQLLNWMEMMSLLGELGSAIIALKAAQRIVKVRDFDSSHRSANETRGLDTEFNSSDDRNSGPPGRLCENDTGVLSGH